ncbi:2-dehydropantoate 2-reductase [Fusarium austroafricanum]|uniref:2-dehydropantoate 2-reductase n=1 Tax=Fusarium austroafricanum TaxID=2364996 RepID=A0A8H4KDH1_9HYPO|nr:2-dehydropantoate 2-reductase [Fusarium austroafricanum]
MHGPLCPARTSDIVKSRKQQVIQTNIFSQAIEIRKKINRFLAVMATRNVTGTQVRQSMATSGSAVKTRQFAEAMRGLGSWHGGLFMAASKVLGEESVKADAQPGK